MPTIPLARLILAMLLPPLSAFGQATFEEKVTVSHVEIPVTVIGRDGGAVRGLSRENFVVFDNGTRRPIDTFETIDFASSDLIEAVSPLHPASRRNFLLLFDLSFSSPVSIGRAQQAARDFVARGTGRRDLVAVGAIDVARGFQFLTAFTSDRNLLMAAIADPLKFRGSDPLQIAGTNPLAAGGSSGGGDVSERQSLYDDQAADFKRATDRLDDMYNRQRIERQVEILGTVARSLQRLAGRKHLVLLSEGFDPRLVQGRSVRESAEQHGENSAISSGEVWKVDSDSRFGNAASQKSIARMADEFRRADVVLHSVDIQGVRVQNDVRGGARVNSNDGLFLLSNSTGGTVFRNSNDISSDFERLTRQHEVVYILGFRAPAGTAGELHELKVKLVNVPGARVQHRGAYYAGGHESAIERTLTTAEIIVNDIAQDEIGLDVLAMPFPTASERAQIPVLMEIGGPDLVRHSRNNVATVDIFVYAFDAEGIVGDTVHQRVVLDVAKTGERLAASGIRFYGTLDLLPGRYAIKSLVRVAESDMKGYERIDLVVPEASDAAIGRPIFFAEEGNWIMVKATSDSPDTRYPFVVDGESFIPAVRATLRRGEPRLFTLFLYNADPDEVSWQITPEAKLVSHASTEDVTQFVFALERIPEGTTELDVVLRKSGSDESRRVTVPIEVR